jgi:formimidoylglutamate deiminase
MQTLAPQHLWHAGAWHAGRAVKLGTDGTLAATGPDDASAALTARWMLPGMPNTHSHAFQRAMAGLAEHQTRSDDSFWTWREIMYGFAARIGPDELHAIAAQLYLEMLKAGLHLGLRIPLPAPPARRHAICRSRCDVAGA